MTSSQPNEVIALATVAGKYPAYLTNTGLAYEFVDNVELAITGSLDQVMVMLGKSNISDVYPVCVLPTYVVHGLHRENGLVYVLHQIAKFDDLCALAQGNEYVRENSIIVPCGSCLSLGILGQLWVRHTVSDANGTEATVIDLDDCVRLTAQDVQTVKDSFPNTLHCSFLSTQHTHY